MEVSKIKLTIERKIMLEMKRFAERSGISISSYLTKLHMLNAGHIRCERCGKHLETIEFAPYCNKTCQLIDFAQKQVKNFIDSQIDEKRGK